MRARWLLLRALVSPAQHECSFFAITTQTITEPQFSCPVPSFFPEIDSSNRSTQCEPGCMRVTGCAGGRRQPVMVAWKKGAGKVGRYVWQGGMC